MWYKQTMDLQEILPRNWRTVHNFHKYDQGDPLQCSRNIFFDIRSSDDQTWTMRNSRSLVSMTDKHKNAIISSVQAARTHVLHTPVLIDVTQKSSLGYKQTRFHSARSKAFLDPSGEGNIPVSSTAIMSRHDRISKVNLKYEMTS
jgi:hypothetical protein